MTKGILGRKVGMTQIYDESGKAVPVTVVQAGPCKVLQVKTEDSDGYTAVKLGFEDKPRRLAGKSERGQVAGVKSKRSAKLAAAGVEPSVKADCEPQRVIREFRGSTDGFEVGQDIDVNILEEVKRVDVIGTSKGRGYAGVMKRHNFAGQRASHGVKKVHRHAGGTGMSASPSRLFKGKRMAGQYGNARVTVRNLEVVSLDSENDLILIRGAVPGPNGGMVVIRESNKLG